MKLITFITAVILLIVPLTVIHGDEDTGIAHRVARLEEQVALHNSQIAGLESQVLTLESQVAGLESQVSTLELNTFDLLYLL